MPEEDFAALIAGLAAFRNDRLDRQPSDRAPAKAAGVRPTTIGNWLGGEQFPQAIDPLLELVRAVRAHAARAGLAGSPALAHLADEQRPRGTSVQRLTLSR
ncbi:hypothetical protein [Spongiactinospora sp. 9N601]|uniref:hypothetical protein n=1 Tax=Spongiactinospora sp. 9N601 TaxID=3375149 RepID=UPI0037A229E5